MSREDQLAMQEKIAAGERAEKERQKKEMKKKLKEKKDGFLKDFKKFITKGNVVDMAVGVVIGSAFSAIVNGLVKMIINPCIALIPGAKSLDNLKTVLERTVKDDAGNETVEVVGEILWGEWIQTIINFFIIALSIFVAVRIISGITRRLNAKKIAAEQEAAEKKKAEEKAKADAAAAAVAAEKEALAKFYANVERQTALLEKMAEK